MQHTAVVTKSSRTFLEPISRRRSATNEVREQQEVTPLFGTSRCLVMQLQLIYAIVFEQRVFSLHNMRVADQTDSDSFGNDLVELRQRVIEFAKGVVVATAIADVGDLFDVGLLFRDIL